MPKLSLTMIVRNEEKYLEECLISVKDSADEIVIVDTGSSDKTIEIAEKYGAQVFEFKWINDFSAARNYALSKSTGDWILYLDADERIAPESIKDLAKIKNSKENVGYYCTVKSLDNQNNRDNSMRYIRLFRNIKGIEFKGKVHEQITDSLSKHGAKLFNSNILINHLGYNIPIDEKKTKAERNLKLLLDEFEKTKSGYYAFQLANTYYILDETQKSIKYFQIAAESVDLSKSLKAECYNNIALSVHKRFDSKSALNFINQSIELNREQPFTYLLASKIYLQMGDKLKAEEFCKKAFLVNKQQLGGVNRNDLQIYLDSEEVICSGLLLAIQNNNRDNLNYYQKEYKSFLHKKDSELSNLLVYIVNKLLSVKPLTINEEDAVLSLINKKSSELFYALLENSISVLREEFVENIYNKFKTDLSSTRLLSKYYFETNNIEKAVRILEENRNSVEGDPSSIIYLVSYYLTLGLFGKAEEWIEILEKNFSHMTQIMLIAKNIKEKVGILKKN